MAFDKSKLPPQIREMIERLEASGAKVHIAEIQIEPETSENHSATSETSSPDSAEGFVDTVVEIVKSGLQSLHNHLCPRVKTLEREARDARKDIDELKQAVLRLQGTVDQRASKIG